MSKNRKTFLSRLFNPIARLGRLYPIEIGHAFDLFADYGADPDHKNIESLKRAIDKAILDMAELAKNINCFQSENIFMEELIALRMEVEKYNPRLGHLYPHRDTVAQLFVHKNGFLSKASLTRYFSSGTDDIMSRISASSIGVRLRNLSQKFDTFFETVKAEDLSERLGMDYAGDLANNVGAQRTWDVYMLAPGEAKVNIEGLSAILHNFGTYDTDLNQRKINIRDTLYTIMDWVETYVVPMEELDENKTRALGELREALDHIQHVLTEESNFYDPKYIVVREEALFALDDHYGIFLDASIKLREKDARMDAMGVPGETYTSMAEKLYQVASAIPFVIRNSMMTSSHRPHLGYSGPRPS